MIPVVDLTRIIGWIKTAGADAFKWLIFRAFIINCAHIFDITVTFNFKANFIKSCRLQSIRFPLRTIDFAFVSFPIVGVGAWLANCLQFPACLSVVMSGACC